MITMCFRYLVMALLLILSVAAVARAEVVIEVSAGKHNRIDTPLSVKLPVSLQGNHFNLKRLDADTSVPVQIISRKKRRLIWLLGDPLAAGETRRYRLSPSEKPSSKNDAVTVDDDGKRLRVAVGGKPVLVYNTALVPSPNRKEPYYDRSGYIHPVYNPAGQAITDDFAPDHPHQHGIMLPWTNTKFEGRSVNFWDQNGGTGRIEHATTQSLVGGPVFGGFAVGLKQLDTTTPDKPKAVLDETWLVRVYNLADAFLFDFESTQQCVGNPLQIEKYHYGGFAIRGHRNWLTRGQGDFLTSEGKTRANGNHTRPRWVDIYGYVEGEMTGITIFCHPANYRAPQPVRLHPQKPYFCFAPMVLGEFEIRADEPYTSRYRFYVHNGELDTRAAERRWNDIADPPTVTIIASGKTNP